MTPWWSLLVVALADAPGAPAESVAVLPFHAPDASVGEDGLDLLSTVLAAQLAEQGHLRVISAEELRALMRNEQDRQALGGGEDDALREMSGAMGASAVVTGSVARTGARLVWQAALAPSSDPEKARRAEVSGATLQALAARADEVALALLGRGTEADSEETAKRLGFRDVADVKDFAGFRAEHPEMGVQEALTQYIVEHNVEPNRLSLAESGLFLGGGGLTTLAMVTASAAFLMALYLPLGPLALPISCGSCVLGLSGLGLMLTSAGVSAWDGLNRQFRRVQRKGCCRDDARIQDAVSASTLRKGTALAVLVGGPAWTVLTFSTLIWLGVGASVFNTLRSAYGINLQPGWYTASPASYLTSPFTGTTYACAVCGCITPCLIGVPLGSLLLFWPDPQAVQGVEGT
ncbi:MAG: hypothetical protein HY904_06630 [Deltaproteobacteria bacterium]|nr:hypothetical protein [Deltaproteobacteria bacterium]